MDAAGRLLVAPELRQFAQLEKQVWLVGSGQSFRNLVRCRLAEAAGSGFALLAISSAAGLEDLAL
jgi:MraZ protein